MNSHRLIESDAFSFEFLSKLGERESWRKEVHRPIYHVHKWWAKRLGSVFRGILLGCMLPEDANLPEQFYRRHNFGDAKVFDPFMGSGTTVGEAHKLGMTAFGRDINPVAVESVRVAFGPLDRKRITRNYEKLSEGAGEAVRALYLSEDSRGRICDVLYYFWVMQTACPECGGAVDLFPSYVFAKNARPHKKSAVHILCPSCGQVFGGLYGQPKATCPACDFAFHPEHGPANGRMAVCGQCRAEYAVIDAIGGKKPPFRLYAKLVLRKDGKKEYLPTSPGDIEAYRRCSRLLRDKAATGSLSIPALALQHGYNTRQAMRYGFRCWRDFFNDRQLLALLLLRSAIAEIADVPTRDALWTLFSGVLEFNNLFASYKGEGTGAVRHMFSHHILKPERMPIEANVWGTPKSSGSFSNLFRSRLMRALDYRDSPTEVNGTGCASGRVCSPPFSGVLHPWDASLPSRAIALSNGDSSVSGLPDKSVDAVVTDPPFFDNVHYSELADFFQAWRQFPGALPPQSTRNENEVQDADADRFSSKLRNVFRECHRVLKDDGLLAFTYHHSRDDGWSALADAVIKAGFVVVNTHPVKSEMSVAAPKSQAKSPIQLDIILVCKKAAAAVGRSDVPNALRSGRDKLRRLRTAGFQLSRNDRKIVLYGQLLTTLNSSSEVDAFAGHVRGDLEKTPVPAIAVSNSLPLFPGD